VRAIWNDENTKRWSSVLDIVGILNEEPDYNKSRNYWKYLKAILKKESNHLVSANTQLKLLSTVGKTQSKLLEGQTK
jgi:cell filamentation protein